MGKLNLWSPICRVKGPAKEYTQSWTRASERHTRWLWNQSQRNTFFPWPTEHETNQSLITETNQSLRIELTSNWAWNLASLPAQGLKPDQFPPWKSRCSISVHKRPRIALCLFSWHLPFTVSYSSHFQINFFSEFRVTNDLSADQGQILSANFPGGAGLRSNGRFWWETPSGSEPRRKWHTCWETPLGEWSRFGNISPES